MLLSRTIASIPSTTRQSIALTDDLQNPPVILVSSRIPPSLQYFNIRVTDRLHRYRSLKRQWNEAASTTQIDTPIPPPTIEIEPVTHEQLIKDYENFTDTREKNHIAFDPLHTQIQSDLIRLRRLIKRREKKFTENSSSKTSFHHRSSAEPSSKTNTLDHVKISGSQMRPSTFPAHTNPTTDPRQSSLSRQQTIHHIFNMYRTRVNHQPLSPDSHIQGVPPPKKTLIIPPKTTLTINGKQTPSHRSPMPTVVIKKKQTTFIKSETFLSSVQQPSPIEPTTTCAYTYAASTSATSPGSKKLNRKTSILPILLSSSPCMGVQPRRSQSGKTRDANEQSYNLQDYKHLVHHLPKPVIPIASRYDQDDCEILFEQLDHIRETMPNANVYENYARGS